MKRKLLMSLVVMISLGGCTSYYKVTDPHTNRVYYTSELKQKGNGAAEFKDARTGSRVTITNSEVEQIKKQEFETGKNTAPAETPSKTTM
jgi:hypothetical protein